MDTAFGLPGDGINGSYEALRTYQHRLRLTQVRREKVDREMTYFTSSVDIVERAKEKLPDALRVQCLFRESSPPGVIAPLGLA